MTDSFIKAWLSYLSSILTSIFSVTLGLGNFDSEGDVHGGKS